MADEILTAATVNADRLITRADKSTAQRGIAYYTQGRARIAALDSQSAVVHVQGSQRYEVDIWMDGREARTVCDCPIADGDPDILCKHQIAAALALRAYLQLHPPVTWESVLSSALKDPPRRKATARQVLLFSLQQRYSSWSLHPYSLAASRFPPEALDDPEAIARTIRRERLSREATAVRSPGNSQRFVNITDTVRAALQVLAAAGQYGYYYGGGPTAGVTLLPQLAGGLVFRGTEYDPLQRRVQVSAEPATPELEVTDTPDGLHLRASVRLGEGPVPLDPKATQVIATDPLWLLSGDQAFAVDDPSGTILAFVKTPELLIPPEARETFLTRYLLPLAERMAVVGAGITHEEMDADPVPRLYLSEEGGTLQVRLRFGYDDCEVPYDKRLPETSVQRRPDALALVQIRRRPAQEQERWQSLADHGLKRSPEPDVFVLRARTDPVDFLLHQVPGLLAAGFGIYGEEALTSARVNRNRPKLSLVVSSGIDWFDVQAVVQFGDATVPLKEVRRAVRRQEKYVKLADGTLGAIPDDWLERYRYLFALGEETDEGLRLSQHHVTVLDQLLAEGEQVEADAEFARRRERLRSFAEITPTPAPEPLVGVLRPYQKAGYDWLHFLHEYGFGGCLADDMGVGKTIQTLALLLSLRESGHARSADLIVMPRSLLFNWAREAAKFAPSLRLLTYADTSRPQDTAEFDKYDLVLTTYGILRRDIERLRGYQFHYAILDESQAIKNPLGQTAKAARLLRADHRLALTGTPVENSTTELWSQFAFLNPGLLGSLDAFRTEFAGAIEKRGDEVAAAFLRTLVHPFLLRRTKDQVAADLPPRTERLLYTEMEPAQRKLYNQKKEYYRAQIMGLLEQEGMDNARMKILEGLLRLRQISNHPRLAEPGYAHGSGKFEALLETLETLRAEGHKALVFSQFVQMLTLVRQALDAHHVPYVYLDGKTKDRQAVVDTFQADPSLPFFLISLRAGGVGLNLTAADYVIHVDPWWNPAVEMQATDRTHRIGQDKPVFVYKLIARDSVEEKILQLQERKRALVSQLIATETGFFKSLTRQDIEVLFD